MYSLFFLKKIIYERIALAGWLECEGGVFG